VTENGSALGVAPDDPNWRTCAVFTMSATYAGLEVGARVLAPVETYEIPELRERCEQHSLTWWGKQHRDKDNGPMEPQFTEWTIERVLLQDDSNG
jgi:hypothetical protein